MNLEVKWNPYRAPELHRQELGRTEYGRAWAVSASPVTKEQPRLIVVIKNSANDSIKVVEVTVHASDVDDADIATALLRMLASKGDDDE